MPMCKSCNTFVPKSETKHGICDSCQRGKMSPLINIDLLKISEAQKIHDTLIEHDFNKYMIWHARQNIQNIKNPIRFTILRVATKREVKLVDPNYKRIKVDDDQICPVIILLDCRNLLVYLPKIKAEEKYPTFKEWDNTDYSSKCYCGVNITKFDGCCSLMHRNLKDEIKLDELKEKNWILHKGIFI